MSKAKSKTDEMVMFFLYMSYRDRIISGSSIWSFTASSTTTTTTINN
jgi:hypothetical protein